MTVPTGELFTARFSTDDFSERDRLAAWREFFGRKVAQLEIEPLVDQSFRSVARVQVMPDLVVASGIGSAAHYRMTKELISGDDLAVIISNAPLWGTTQLGREVTLGRCDAVLMRNDASGDLVYGDPRRPIPSRDSFTSFRVPRSIMSLLVRDLDAALVKRIPAGTEGLRLLRGYLALLEDTAGLASTALNGAAARHVHDLTALALGATRDAAEIARGRGVRAARLAAIKRDIANRLDRPDLDVGNVARRNRVTPRYVQMLFEGEGTTFTAYVLDQRLLRAYRKLTDDRLSGRSITMIAIDAGFGSLAYFNRTFRRHFGGTPSDMRNDAKRLPDG